MAASHMVKVTIKQSMENFGWKIILILYVILYLLRKLFFHDFNDNLSSYLKKKIKMKKLNLDLFIDTLHILERFLVISV